MDAWWNFLPAYQKKRKLPKVQRKQTLAKKYMKALKICLIIPKI